MVWTDTRVDSLRSQFPALDKQVDGKTAVFFDGPAGTQVPQSVIDAIGDYLVKHNANHCGVFATSVESDRLLNEAHRAAADLLGVNDPDSIAFGANMTTLALALSRALAKSWEPGDEIVLSRLEHDANFSPWVLAAQDRGVTIRYVEVNPDDCTLRLEQYAELINSRTKLVAVGCASNAVGTVNPVKQICKWARDAGALSFLDAVHYAPHALIDVIDWDCDFLVCSAYKFFGPHVGILYGRRTLLEAIQPYKLRPSPDELPGRWMTGTQNHEGIAGTLAAIDYLAQIGLEEIASDYQPDNRGAGQQVQSTSRREALVAALTAIRAYEHDLLLRLLDGLRQIPNLKVWGITDPHRLAQRLPTVSINHQTIAPRQLAEHLAADAIFVWHGNYYALPLTESLGVEPEGMVRIGLCHYNNADEVDRLLASLERIASLPE